MHVLAINLCGEDLQSLRTISRGCGWRLTEVTTLRAALTCLSTEDVPVVICERAFGDEDWRGLLTQVQSLPRPPRLIVASRLADETLWSEVLSLGAYDLIATPFRESEVTHTLTCARRAWYATSVVTAQAGAR
jgi:DNA-binding response OmpR family regulator